MFYIIVYINLSLYISFFIIINSYLKIIIVMHI